METTAASRQARWGFRTVGSVLALALVGCASPSYLFRPTENVTATSDGYPAARYPVPPESPRGTIYVASFGVVQGDMIGDGHDVPFLQVRLTVANNSGGGPWTVDTRQQLLAISGAGQSRPALVNSDQQDAPTITVPVGGKRTIDLYYTLPANMSAARDVPDFDLLWQVQTATRPVAERTPFEKERIEPSPPASAYATADYGPGWGSYWWYDPYYPELAFLPPPIVLHDRYPVLVHHSIHPRMTASRGVWHGYAPGHRH